MKIAFDLQVCQSIETAFRGIGRYSLDFTKEAVSLISDHHEVLAVLNRNLQSRQGHIQTTLGLPQKQYRFFNPANPFSDISEQRRFYSRVQNYFYASEKCDVVHNSSIFEYTLPFMPHFFPASSERIFSATLYDLIPLRMKERYLLSQENQDWYMAYVRSLERQNLLLAISEATRKEALELLDMRDDQIINISSAVDSSKFYTQNISEELKDKILKKYAISKRFILYTAGFDARKNMDGLIAAYAKLPLALREKLQLVIVCSTPEGATAEIERWCKSAGVRRNEDVVFTGFVPDDDLRYLYNLTELFVFPSLYEGFGLPIVEAIQCGAPAIGSDCSSIVEILDRPDLRFDPNNTDSITQKMHEVLSNATFRNDILDFERKYIQKFSWTNVAKTALSAWENAVKQQREQKKTKLFFKQQTDTYKDRKRLAIFTPIPGQKSGIADFTARVITFLSPLYEITVFTEAPHELIAPAAKQLGVSILHHSAFNAQAKQYDQIIYQVGNNVLHQFMFPYIKSNPGIVELHDFYIGHSLQSIPCNPAERLAAEHGIDAVLKIPDMMPDQEETVWKYSYNHWIFEQPTVILHSDFAKNLLDKFYPQGYPADVHIIPLPSRLPAAADNTTSIRKKLNIPEDAFLITSLGVVSPLKKPNVLAAAFQILKEKFPERKIVLVFGGTVIHDFQVTIDKTVKDSVYFTGYLDENEYWSFIRESDVVVQLREQSRGESSGTILDIMTIGRPLVLNEHGSFSSYPESCVYKVQDKCTHSDLAETISHIMLNAQKENKSEAQRNYIAENNSAQRITYLHRTVIEESIALADSKNVRNICSAIIKDMKSADTSVITTASQVLPHFKVSSNRQRILLDISLFIQQNYKTGIQRVVANIADYLCNKDSELLFLPVALHGNKLFYCRYNEENKRYEYVNEWEALPRDILLLLDSSWIYKDVFLPIIRETQNWGGVAYSVVYDILPLQQPELFPPETLAIFQPWLKNAVENTNGFICISKSVAQELKEYIQDNNLLPRDKILPVGHFYLGSDFFKNDYEKTPVKQLEGLPSISSTSRIFLSVGTIEPRKNYPYMLKVLENLWAKNEPVIWIIVGKEGWFTEAWLKELFNHPEYKQHIFYFPKVDDGQLHLLYQRAEFLYQLSLGEGYGLPLIEASAAGVSVICSDIPVFHEIEQDFSFTYCPLESADQSAQIIEALLKKTAHNRKEKELLPAEVFSWADSAEMLAECIVQNKWDFFLS